MQFDNRRLLSTHLSRGYGTCWLHMILWVPPLTSTELVDARKSDREVAVVRERAGISSSFAEALAFRVLGPLHQIYDFDGAVVVTTSSKHPFGPQRRKYLDGNTDSAVE